MVCVRLPAVKFKRRVPVTVWAGAFVRFAAFEVAGRLLGVLGTRALSRLRTSDTFESPTAWGSPNVETFEISIYEMALSAFTLG
jgi:hypothetical protein